MKIFFFLSLFYLSLFGDSNTTMLTPVEYSYKISLGDKITPYHRYAQYFLENKINNDKSKLMLIFESNDKYLGYHEATIKGIYDFYITKNYKDSLGRIDKAYDRQSNLIKGSFESIFIHDIYLEKENYDKLNTILPNSSYCLLNPRKIDKEACLSTIIARDCILNKEYSSDLINLITLNENLANFTIKYCSIKRGK